ncbi:hypothetical protein Ga0466249_001907 [Sporomusaceae bacterium BoRhaA]|jgi:hypothetical protein|uniref:hypothetical protein n=1 Tax=Pelorhabdus rhamnosifermentans TaxID=2772457 RepID=UPI001C063C9F|nr:hypothetical protein [Pelorhabdus rhamnosifermentans]MBU2700802.1 hypothetical protein [Pelorhabdus rhamnosifermentans]
MSTSLRVSCLCGNTERLSNKMEKFNICLSKFMSDSQTGKIKLICKACGQETDEILIGN